MRSGLHFFTLAVYLVLAWFGCTRLPTSTDRDTDPGNTETSNSDPKGAPVKGGTESAKESEESKGVAIGMAAGAGAGRSAFTETKRLSCQPSPTSLSNSRRSLNWSGCSSIAVVAITPALFWD
jgi:hypothetical protein